MEKLVKNDLFDYENRYIFQYENAFKFSVDSILLAEFVSGIKDKTQILDLCTGNCVIPLILTTKSKCHIDAVELQKDIYDIALKSVLYNNLEEYIYLYNIDALEINKHINKKYDIIICNPPYFKVEEKSLVNKNKKLNIARHELKIKLEDIFKIASKYLNDGGVLFMVHISSRLDEIIVLGKKYNLGIKKVQLIKTKHNKKPSIVLVKAIKNSSNGIIFDDVLNIENLKSYKNIFREK